MASAFLRSTARTSLFSSLKSNLKPKSSRIPTPTASSSSSTPRRLPFVSRLPVELGSCSGSMLPLHSAVAAARLTSCLSSSSRSCRALSQGTLCRTSPSL